MPGAIPLPPIRLVHQGQPAVRAAERNTEAIRRQAAPGSVCVCSRGLEREGPTPIDGAGPGGGVAAARMPYFRASAPETISISSLVMTA